MDRASHSSRWKYQKRRTVVLVDSLTLIPIATNPVAHPATGLVAIGGVLVLVVEDLGVSPLRGRCIVRAVSTFSFDYL